MAGTLKVDTIAENTSAAGVTIDGVLIKDGGITAKEVVTAALVNGAVTIAPGTVVFTKDGVAAMTLAAPSAAQEGTRMIFTAGTANAHTLTATGLIEDGVTGGAKNLATFGAFVGSSLTLVAVNLKWHVVDKNICTITGA